MRHPRTYWGRLRRKPASLGLEPRQRDPESLVLPLHHEALRDGKIASRSYFRNLGDWSCKKMTFPGGERTETGSGSGSTGCQPVAVGSLPTDVKTLARP